MIRGSHIYKDLLHEGPAKPVPAATHNNAKKDTGATPNGRGRNNELIQQRNEHILYRFVWYSTDGSRMYDWVVKQLRHDFYLSESTIGQIIAAHGDIIARIRREKPSSAWLARKYPCFKW